MDLEIVAKKVEDQKLIAVRFEQTVTTGVARSKTIASCHFREKASKGLSVFLLHTGMDVRGTLSDELLYDEETDFGDALMFPDYETFRVLPWLDRVGRILVEPTYKGEPVTAHPRVVARRQLERLEGLGISLLSAHEHEFYLFHKESMKPVAKYGNLHASVLSTPLSDLFGQFLEHLPKVGVSVESVENEIGPGQVEITYKPVFGIRAADNAHTYRTSVKEIALLNGYVASFMSIPFPGASGSSAHFCHSLWDGDGKVPLLFDPSDPLGLSQLGQHWIAGILAHAPAIQLLVAPTANCLKQIQPYTPYPINATWGFDNRSVDIRVKIKGEEGTYIEHRAVTSGSNPYISLAATVAAGIDGITKKLPLPPQVKGNASVEANVPPETPQLPSNLEDALNALNNDEVITDALGQDFIRYFSAIKRQEVKLQTDAEAKGDEDWEWEYLSYFL